MDYKVIPITQLEHASWDQVKDGNYVVPIGFPDQTTKESKYIDIWQLQDTINVTDMIDQATESRSGLMSIEDKIKLDGITDSNILNGQAEGSLRTIGSTQEGINYYLGQYAFAEGQLTTASGHNSHAEGFTTAASGDSSHTEGQNTTASEDCSHAEGYYSTASGNSSHAEGYNTTASGDYSHTQNIGTIATSLSQTALGKYNLEDRNDTYSVIVGNGTDSSRSNAATLDWSGNLNLAGDVYVNNSTSENNKLVKYSEVSNIINNSSISTIENKVNKTAIGFTINGQSKDISNTSFLDLIYPVGSIYMSMNTDNPSTLFGGTWQALAPGKMLLGADEENYITGDPNKGSGGNKDAVLVQHTHTITQGTPVGVSLSNNHKVDQPAFTYPSHQHDMGGQIWSNGSSGSYSCYMKTTKRGRTTKKTTKDGGGSCTRTTNVGVAAHAVTITQPTFSNDTRGVSPENANMPPYLVVNMWQRIS